MAFKTRHFIQCDSCGKKSELFSEVRNESNRKSAALLKGFIRYKKMEFCDEVCKKEYLANEF